MIWDTISEAGSWARELERQGKKQKYFRDAARDQSCIRCGADDGTVVGAHYTGVRREAYGGGLGLKVHDLCIAQLCMKCHIHMDSTRDKNDKWLHSEEFQHLILLTLIRLWNQGRLTLK